jgi:hypothetical protein
MRPSLILRRPAMGGNDSIHHSSMSNNPHNDSSLLDDLRKASAGVEYPSESDAPFDPFHWTAQAVRGGSALEQITARGGAGRKVEQVSIEQFFEPLRESDDADRFTALRRVLESRLTKLKIFRVGAGEVKVDIYLIGQTPSGNWAGLHTTSIET